MPSFTHKVKTNPNPNHGNLVSKIRLNKKEFKQYLQTALRFGEERCQLICEDRLITILLKKPAICSHMNTIIPISSDYVGRLNIQSLPKLERLVNLVVEDEIVLDLHPQYIECRTSGFVYRMHLGQGSGSDRVLNMDAVKQLSFPFEFKITHEEYRSMKALTKLVDAVYKLYFTKVDDKIVVTLTNRDASANPYSDSIAVPLSASAENWPKDFIIHGDFLTIPLIGRDEEIACRTDGKKCLLMTCNTKLYYFSTLLT